MHHNPVSHPECELILWKSNFSNATYSVGIAYVLRSICLLKLLNYAVNYGGLITLITLKPEA